MDPAKEYTLHIEPPETLLDKIHLYNAMLQLGLPKFVSNPSLTPWSCKCTKSRSSTVISMS